MRRLWVIGCCLLIIGCLLPAFGYAQKFKFVKKPSQKRLDLYYGKNLITSYIYYDSLFKYALYPLSTVSGTHITREYPYVLKAGERADHPHHVGLFFAHESVNGLDFWNMSTAIPPDQRYRYGKIKSVEVTGTIEKKKAQISTMAAWQTQNGQDLLLETTVITFSVSGSDLVIDRITALATATPDAVTIIDKKDALMGLRVARELELRVEGEDRFVLPDGSISPPQKNDISKVTGDYKNSESVIGAEVWGKKANWVCLDGQINSKDISVAIIDHPQNIDYPSYWHARGYGLFAVNPLGKEVFTEGKAKINLVIKSNDAVYFRYRIVIREGGKLTPAELNQYLKTFSENK